jgi:predicted ATPase
VITAIEIEGLRGIRQGALQGLAPLTVLTGPISSGKSTVLEALSVVAAPQPFLQLQDLTRRRTAGGRAWR